MAATPGSPSGAATTSPTTTPSTTITPLTIWQTLEQYGASAIQAAGIMGNWIAESSLNPEASVIDTNGYGSYGLAQWNAASYPNASSLVTGNPAADLVSQVVFFFQTVPQSALTGSTPAQVASNLAANYERCSTCQQGGSSNEVRQANATLVASWASSGSWPSTISGASDTADITSAEQAAAAAACAWQIDIPIVGSMCLVQNSQIRAAAALGLLVAGGLVALFAISGLLASTPVGQAAGKLVETVGASSVLA